MYWNQIFFTKIKQSEHSVIQGLLEILDYLIGDKSQGPTAKKLKNSCLTLPGPLFDKCLKFNYKLQFLIKLSPYLSALFK